MARVRTALVMAAVALLMLRTVAQTPGAATAMSGSNQLAKMVGVKASAAAQTRQTQAPRDVPGSAPGRFYVLHDIAADSKGNVYTAEVDLHYGQNSRAQKFVFKGLSSAK